MVEPERAATALHWLVAAAWCRTERTQGLPPRDPVRRRRDRQPTSWMLLLSAMTGMGGARRDGGSAIGETKRAVRGRESACELSSVVTGRSKASYKMFRCLPCFPTRGSSEPVLQKRPIRPFFQSQTQTCFEVRAGQVLDAAQATKWAQNCSPGPG